MTPLEMNRLTSEERDEQSLPKSHERVAQMVEGKRILDLGCGNGHFRKILKDKKVVNVDCIKKPHIDYTLDLSHDKLPFKNGEFDTVLMCDVLEHLENPWHATREAKRVGKTVIVVVPAIDNLINRLIFLVRKRFWFYFQEYGGTDGEGHVTPIFPKQLDWMRDDWKLEASFVYKDPTGGGGTEFMQKWRKP
jgi:ubiquinone/menaquinone biosynthesis C-methylase UbiE